jgi:hypothetical protein
MGRLGGCVWLIGLDCLQQWLHPLTHLQNAAVMGIVAAPVTPHPRAHAHSRDTSLFSSFSSPQLLACVTLLCVRPQPPSPLLPPSPSPLPPHPLPSRSLLRRRPPPPPPPPRCQFTCEGGRGDGRPSGRRICFGRPCRSAPRPSLAGTSPPGRCGGGVSGFTTGGSKFLSIVRRARMVSSGDNEVYTGSGLRGVIPYVQCVAAVFLSQVCS